MFDAIKKDNARYAGFVAAIVALETSEGIERARDYRAAKHVSATADTMACTVAPKAR